MPNRQLRGLAKADDARHILGAAAPSALLMATANQRLVFDALAYIERADSLWPVQLVARQRQEIDLRRFHVDRQLSDRLHRIGVKQRPRRMRQIGKVRRQEKSSPSHYSPT